GPVRVAGLERARDAVPRPRRRRDRLRVGDAGTPVGLGQSPPGARRPPGVRGNLDAGPDLRPSEVSSPAGLGYNGAHSPVAQSVEQVAVAVAASRPKGGMEKRANSGNPTSGRIGES